MPGAGLPMVVGVSRLAGWQIWLITGTTLSLASVVVPATQWTFMAFTAGIGLLSAIVAVVGTMRLRRPAAAAWIYLALAIGLNSSGSIVETLDIEVFHYQGSLSPALPFYLMMYPFLAISVSVIIRRRSASHEASHLLDSLIITAGLGLLCWILVVSPDLGDSVTSILTRAANALGPTGDLVIMAALVRLLLHGGWRIPALRQLTAALVMFLAVDIAWSTMNLMNPPYEPGRLLTAVVTLLPLLAYVCSAAAPLHPSAEHLLDAHLTTEHKLGPLLLISLTLACLIAPVTLLVEALRGVVIDGVAIAVFAAALTLLVVLRMADLVRRVQSQSAQLRELALEDPLTGLANRRALTVRLSSEMELARRRPHSLAVAMIDLDFFKRFNDTYGHAAGDQLLCAASGEWRGALRASDFLARMGGEEFLVILPGVSPDEAEDSIARLQAVVPLAQSFSAGVALWDGQELSEELVERADAAMYQAKMAGRARCEVAVTDKPAWPLSGSGLQLTVDHWEPGPATRNTRTPPAGTLAAPGHASPETTSTPSTANSTAAEPWLIAKT
jgi:diguanylate cyclase (GGDEF)-like protein